VPGEHSGEEPVDTPPAPPRPPLLAAGSTEAASQRPPPLLPLGREHELGLRWGRGVRRAASPPGSIDCPAPAPPP